MLYESNHNHLEPTIVEKCNIVYIYSCMVLQYKNEISNKNNIIRTHPNDG